MIKDRARQRSARKETSAELYIEPNAHQYDNPGLVKMLRLKIRMPTRNLLLSFALIAIAIVLTLSQRQVYPQIDRTLMLQRIDGVQQHFADFHGKPLLVTFWSPTCVICMHEVDALNNLYEQGGRGHDFELLGISMFYDRPDHVLAAHNRAAMQYPVYLDLDSAIATAFGRVQVTPTSFVINSSGEIVLKLDGKLDFNLINKKLKQLTV